MAEDFDVEAMLEAPYRKDEDRNGSPPPPSLSHQNGGSSGRSKKENGGGRRRSRSASPAAYDDLAQTSPRDTVAHRSAGHKERDTSRDGAVAERRGGDERSERHRSKDRERKRGGSKERRRSRSRERRRRSRSRDKKGRRVSPSSRERRRSRSRDRAAGGAERRRSRSPVGRSSGKRMSPSSRRRSRTPPRRHRSPSPRPFRRGRTPPNGLGNRSPPEDLSPEERDARTVFCMQLSQRIRARDLEEFFSSVGKVRDVRLITCNKTKRFKGIAYIEFKDPESVPLALGLSGQRLLGIPISVQHTQAEKNRMANTLPNLQPPKNHVGPMRLYVGSLHFNITEDMLRGIFEPFGKIDSIQLIMDPETNRSKGYGFITFHNADDAKKALEQLNGFELAGRPMKVGNVTERLDVNTNASLDTDEMDRSGIDLGATGRLQLMFKLAEGAGLAVPQAAANALLATAPQPPPAPTQPAPSIATQCFLLSNMFDPGTETNPTWDVEITDDVIEECKKHGGILHVYVDKASQGNVYVKCPSIATAVLAVNSLHGRWFAGRVITAAYVPLVNYHALFPDALTAQALLSSVAKKT